MGSGLTNYNIISRLNSFPACYKALKSISGGHFGLFFFDDRILKPDFPTPKILSKPKIYPCFSLYRVDINEDSEARPQIQLEAEFFADEDDVDPVRDQVGLEDDELAADPVGRMAVRIGTKTQFGAWCVHIHADGIHGAGNGLDPGDGILQGDDGFVHSDHEDYFFRAVNHGGHPVAGAVHVDQLPVRSDGVAAGDVDV